MVRKIIIWALALVITLIAAIYQRKTGPTYPQSYKIQIGSDIYKGELLRTHAGDKECLLEVPIDDKEITGLILYKRYKTKDEYKPVSMVMYHGELCGVLPHQDKAGKLQYYIELMKDGKSYFIARDEPVVIRFRGDVPGYVMIPHILLLFLSMFFATLCGLYILFKQENFKKYVSWAFFTLLIGGFVFGPLMQWYAFGEFWTGIPFGFDLTDNKTLFVFAFWLWAYLANRKKTHPVPVLVACIMTLVIFSIPHSAMGSELNYTTNKINSGMILFQSMRF